MSLTYKSRQLPKITCPYCGALCDGCTGIGPEGDELIPCDGDTSTCFYCATLLKFHGGSLVYATEEDLQNMPPDLRKVVEKLIKQPIRIGP